MDEIKIIGLIFLVVLASGCSDTKSKPQAIEIKELSIEPSTLPAGSSTTVTLEIVNSGSMKAEVPVGGKNGSKLLTNYCSDLFTIEQFTASSARSSSQKNSYTLGKGEKLKAVWRIKQDNKGDVPLPGYNCPMRLQIPFNYSVSAYKQIQVKKKSDTEGSSKLSSKMTNGPLAIEMKLVGSTAETPNTLLVRDNKSASLYITAYNRGDQETNKYRGLIRMGKLDIEKTGSVIKIDNQCGKESTKALATGDNAIYKCPINITEINSQAAKAEITAQINYTYVRDLGSRQVKVKYVG